MRKSRLIHRTAAVLLVTALTLSLGACGKSENKEQDAYRQYGINCLESGNYEEAVQSFQNALDQSLGSVGEKELDICFYKAKAQYLSGDTDAAFETYNSIIKYNKDARAYYLRGNLYFDIGEQEQALADYEQALERDKKNYELYIGVYQSMSRHGLSEDGQKYLNQAMEIKGDKAQDQLYKGRICYLLGDYEGAVDYLTKAKEGNEKLAAYYLGLAYEAQGEDEKAQTYIQEYIDSGAASSYDLYQLGSEEMADEDYASALTYFNAALALEEIPNKQNLMKSAIAAYEYSGDFDSAKNMVKEYLNLYPSDVEVQKESTFLETR